MRPWFGLHLPSYTFPDAAPGQLFDRVVEQARAAEDAGFSLVTVMDHLYQIDGIGPGFEVLRHKTEVLEGYCEEVGRDPATIERTMAAPVIVTASDADSNALLDRLPPERRPYVKIGRPDAMAAQLRPYLDAGFTGFTFNNNFYRTPEQISLVGELLRLVAGTEPVAAA